MPKKKYEPIEGLGRDVDKLTVQKSKPLESLWRSGLTLPEFKILDTYLGRIDSHKPDCRTVEFGKGELEALLGVKRIKTAELDERLKHLGTPIRIDDVTAKNKRFARISLFEKAVAEQDENGLWTVEMTCTQSAMRYFFNIENLGYLRYKLRSVVNITSRYSYIMFVYLESHRHMGLEWKEDLESLKKMLNCDEEESYKAFKYFNDKILKKCLAEITEKTDCRYTYEPVRKGRRVTAIKFVLESRQEQIDQDPEFAGQMTIDEWNDVEAEREEELEEHRKATSPLREFTKEEEAELRTLISSIPSDRLPHDEASGDYLPNRREVYIAQKLAELDRRKPRSRFGYLRKMIEEDAQD